MTRPKVLLLRPGAMGDVCLTVPLAHALQRHCDLTWLVYPHYAPLVCCFPSLQARVLPLALERINPSRPDAPPISDSTLAALRSLRFDAVLDLCHWPETTRLVHHLPDIPLRAIAFDPEQDRRLGINAHGLDLYEPFNLRTPVRPDEHQLNRWRRLVSFALGVNLSPDWPLPPHPAMEQTLRIFLQPHAGKPSKVWPSARYVEALSALGARQPIEVVVNAGNRQEWLRSLALWARLRWRGVRARILFKDRSYRKMIDALQSVHLALGNDSGPIHLASLLGVPTVVVYGPFAPAEFSPPWRSTPVAPAPGQPASAVPVSAVSDALDAALASLAPGARHAA